MIKTEQFSKAACGQSDTFCPLKQDYPSAEVKLPGNLMFMMKFEHCFYIKLNQSITVSAFHLLVYICDRQKYVNIISCEMNGEPVSWPCTPSVLALAGIWECELIDRRSLLLSVSLSLCISKQHKSLIINESKRKLAIIAQIIVMLDKIKRCVSNELHENCLDLISVNY